jgi:hypothetical protein
VACSFEFGLWLWPLEASHFGRPSREAFEGFTLCPAEGFTYYILLAIFSLFLWTLNRMASRLGRP